MRRKAIADVSTASLQQQSGQRIALPIPALTLVSHPICRRAGERLVLDALASGEQVELSRNAPPFTRPGSAFGTPLVDPFVSRKPIRFVPARGGAVRVIVESGGAAVRVGGRACGDIEMSPQEVAAGVPIELSGRVTLLLHLVAPGDAPAGGLGMIGDSEGIRQVRRAIEQIADLSVPVLIRGETGTGKELVARAIHEHGPRRRGPFVAVNLGAIPRDLVAAELFGARRGAYTGAARDREGFFHAAHGGTLFLDEVGEASPEAQVLLLRVLEAGEFHPIGERTPVSVDVRLITATDADLERRIEEGAFRAPLLHRLSGYEIRLPPLRERREDIGALFCHFAREELSAIGEADRLAPEDPYVEPWLPVELAVRLIGHAWPGNVRQLRNVTRQLVIGSRGEPCLQADLPVARSLLSAAAPRVPVPAAEQPGPPAAPRRKSTEVAEAELAAALRDTGWDLKGAARRLGVPRSSLYDLIDRSPGLRTAGDLGAQEIVTCFRDCGGDLDAMVRRLEVSRRGLHRRLKELGLT